MIKNILQQRTKGRNDRMNIKIDFWGLRNLVH